MATINSGNQAFHNSNHNKLRDDLKDLKCSSCKKYLSVPPIFSSEDGRFKKCGRCKNIIFVESVEKTLLRNQIYEKLAKRMQFPCSLSEKCKELVGWDSLDHEKKCPFKIIDCLHKSCYDRYEISSIHSHYSNCHVVYSGNAFTYNFLNFTDDLDVLLLDVNNCFYLACFQKSKEFLEFKVYAVTETKHKFGFEITSSDCNIGYKTCFQIPDHKDFKFIRIKENSVKDVLMANQPEETIDDCQIKLKFFHKDKTTYDMSYINIIGNILECPICHQLMSSNIYFCKTGHSICADCKLQVRFCPICKGFFLSCRNYALEALYQQFKRHYPVSQTP